MTATSHPPASQPSFLEPPPPPSEPPRLAASEDIDKPHKTVRIAVSGDVLLTRLELRVVDTPDFQRLRKYKQLGTSYLVYPSATHTRFEHSLGVLKKTELMMAAIENNSHSQDSERKISPRQRRIARLAALLHDVGNIPFGHTLEDETNVISSYQEDRERLNRHLGPDTSIGTILARNLSESDYALLIDVLSAKKDPEGSSRQAGLRYISDLGQDAFIVDLIKNTVCADLLDYLERDTYFCGLPLSVPDRFLRYLYLHQQENCKRLAIRLWRDKDHRPRAAVISELLQLLETRYFLAERVYFHHAKQISSAMIASAVWHATHQEKKRLAESRLAEMGDEDLLTELLDGRRYPVASKLASAVVERRLYKRFYSLSRERIDSDKLHDHLGYLEQRYHRDARKRTQAEASLCDLAGLEEGDVLIYCPDPRMNFKLAEMNVTSRRGGIEPFHKTGDRLAKSKIKSILESHEHLWELHVFARPEAIKNSAQRDLLRHWCNAFFEEFEGSEDQAARRTAVRGTIDDVLRQEEISLLIPVRDEIVEQAVAVKHRGDVTRRYIQEQILERSRTN